MPPQQMAPALPTTSEKKKKLWISCLNFAKTRVKKYVKILRNILTTNNSSKKIKDRSFAKTIIFKMDIKEIMSIHQNCQSNQIWLNFFKYFLANHTFVFWLLIYIFVPCCNGFRISYLHADALWQSLLCRFFPHAAAAAAAAAAL